MFYPLRILHKKGELTKVSIPDEKKIAELKRYNLKGQTIETLSNQQLAVCFPTKEEATRYLLKHQIRGTVYEEIVSMAPAKV